MKEIVKAKGFEQSFEKGFEVWEKQPNET